MLLAPDSRGATWDWFSSGSFGADAVFIGAALAQARFPTEPKCRLSLVCTAWLSWCCVNRQ